MSEQTLTIIGSFVALSSAGTVVVRVFIRSVVQDELEKLRAYFDTKFETHLRVDHGMIGYYDKTRRPKLRFKEEDNES